MPLPRMKPWHRQLKALDPCWLATEWARQFPTFEDAWWACERPDWLRWLLDRVLDSEEMAKVHKLQRAVEAACDSLGVGKSTWEHRNPRRNRAQCVAIRSYVPTPKLPLPEE